MKYVQKLVLVPIERWEKIGDNIPVKEVTVKTVPQKNTSPLKNQIHPVESVKVKVKNQKGLGKNILPKTSQMFHFLNREKRNQAVRLFHYLLKHNIFSLNSDGEIIRNGETLHDSNLIELISHAVQNDSFRPIGMKYFYKMLKKKNIPERYVSNKYGRKIMNKSLSDETSKWRPPGRLNKM